MNAFQRRPSQRSMGNYLPYSSSSVAGQGRRPRPMVMSQQRFSLRDNNKRNVSGSLLSWKLLSIIVITGLILIRNIFYVAKDNNIELMEGHDIVRQVKRLAKRNIAMEREVSLTSDILEKYNKRLEDLKESNHVLQSEIDRTAISMKVYDRKFEKLHLTKMKLLQQKRTVESALNERKTAQKLSLSDDYVMSEKEKTMSEKLDLLKKHIQRESHREVVEKYGVGPHQVQFEVLLPSASNSSSSFFTVQMAPLDLMPHSVHLFLEQVHHGLWDGCSFMIKDIHIIQIGPYVSSTKSSKLKVFEEAELDTVSFQEYNQNFPHKRYSIGYSGRPGGPDFYINTKDNSRSHGPWGQRHYELEEEADPCFAEVVDGFDVVDSIYDLPADNASRVLTKMVPIQSARIISMKR